MLSLAYLREKALQWKSYEVGANHCNILPNDMSNAQDQNAPSYSRKPKNRDG